MSQKSINTTTSFTVSSNESLNKPSFSTSQSSSQSSADNMTSSDSVLDNHYSSGSSSAENTMFIKQVDRGTLQPPTLLHPQQNESLYGSVESNNNFSQQLLPSLSISQEPILLQTNPLQQVNSNLFSQNFPQKQSPTNQRSSTSSLDSSSSMPINVKSMLLNGLPSDEVLRNWLTSIKCGDYIKNFSEHGYDMHLITRMTPQDLAAIGCKSPALRKKLLLEIKKLNLIDDIPDNKPSSLDKWLELLKLGEYCPRLVAEGYDTIDKVCQLTWEDLEEIGITKLGHQKRILLGIEKIRLIAKREEESLHDNAIYDVHPNHRISLNGENRFGTISRVRSGLFQTRSGANLDHRGLPVAKVLPAFKHVNSALVSPNSIQQGNHLQVQEHSMTIECAQLSPNDLNFGNNRLSSDINCLIQTNSDNHKNNNGQEEAYTMSNLSTTLRKNPPPLPPVRTNSLKIPQEVTNINQITDNQQIIYGMTNNHQGSTQTNYIAGTSSTSFLRTPKLGTLTATTNKMLTLGGHIQTINGQTNTMRTIVPIREAPLPPVQQQSLQKPSPIIPKIDEEPQYLDETQHYGKFNNSEISSSLIGHQLASADEFPPPPPCQ